MKSTQDLCWFLHKLNEELTQNRTINVKEHASIEIYNDKSFNVFKNNPDDAQAAKLYDSEDNGIDLNDIAYMDPKKFAQEIKDNLSVANIKVEDL